jgi:hypothetical protein
LIIIEHDPLLYEESEVMIELFSQAMRDAAKDAQSFYSPRTSIPGGSDQKYQYSILLRRKAEICNDLTARTYAKVLKNKEKCWLQSECNLGSVRSTLLPIVNGNLS